MRPPQRIAMGFALMLLFGTSACAAIWGFADLGQSDASSDGVSVDGGVFADARSAEAGVLDAACVISNQSSCLGQCPDDPLSKTCGCVARPPSTSCIEIKGTTMQGSACTSDSDCVLGLGCEPTSGKCSKWCNAHTMCPVGICHDTAADKYATLNNEKFWWCY